MIRIIMWPLRWLGRFVADVGAAAGAAQAREHAAKPVNVNPLRRS